MDWAFQDFTLFEILWNHGKSLVYESNYLTYWIDVFITTMCNSLFVHWNKVVDITLYLNKLAWLFKKYRAFSSSYLKVLTINIDGLRAHKIIAITFKLRDHSKRIRQIESSLSPTRCYIVPESAQRLHLESFNCTQKRHNRVTSSLWVPHWCLGLFFHLSILYH